MEKSTELISCDTEYDGGTSLVEAQPYQDFVSDGYVDRAINMAEDVIAIAKTESAIAKKEKDTASLSTKTYMESEKNYVDFLIKDCSREGISPEEIRENKKEIKAAQLRMKEKSEQICTASDNSPYTTPGKWKVPAAVGICMIITFCGVQSFYRSCCLT